MKKIIVLVFNLLILINLNAQDDLQSTREELVSLHNSIILDVPVLEVIFGGGFKGDTVTCSLEDQVIFEDFILNSHSCLPLAAKEFTVFRTKSKNKIKIHLSFRDKIISGEKFQEKIFIHKLKNKENFEITITMNGTKYNFLLNTDKGVFFVFYKDDITKKVDVDQHRCPLTFE